jgi:hypothetical protein
MQNFAIMGTKELIYEINLLPKTERWYVLEELLRTLRESERQSQLENAVSELQEEYRSNKELVAFTEIDFENFYEAR